MIPRISNRLLRAGLLALTLSLVNGAGRAESGEPEPGDTLTVMTYNLRFASATPPNAWPQRRPLMREVITQISPDVFGTQEGLYGQLQDLATDLPDYNWIGVGRDDGRRKGEFMAIFYRRTRLEPLSTNYFWLSDTPEVPGSTTWGNENRRMVTAVKFRDLQTRRIFNFWDTHFDHQVQLAREKSAALIRKRISALPSSVPLLLVGDFNAVAGQNRAYHALVDDGFLVDTWKLAKQRGGEDVDTFNGFKGIVREGHRIDWILARGEIVVDREEIVTFSKEGQFPSDHFPLVAKLRFAAKK